MSEQLRPRTSPTAAGTSPFGAPSTRALGYARWAGRNAFAILLMGLLFSVGGAYLASRLELRTAVHELLPNKDPGVVALMRTQERMGNLSLLLVGIRSPDRAANERYAEALTQKLRALPPKILETATYHVRDLRSFFDKNRLLYLSESELESIRDRVRTEIGKRKNPLLVDLGDDEESEDLAKSIEAKKDRLGGRFPDGLFASQDGTYLWIAALPPGGIFVERGGEALFEAANRLTVEANPTSFHPEMKVDVGGPIATGIATRKAVERDIVWVTVTCLVIVAISIGLFFRRVRAVPLVGIPAVVGTILAFAVAQLAFGYLNSSTAFLGSIIVGNGINYAIVLMSRYEEHRAAGEDAIAAIAGALDGVVRGTVVASIGASAAYASLMLTSFRGFYQFGVMGGAGVLLCWAATFVLLPPMLILLDRRQRAGVGQAPIGLGALGQVLDRRPGLVLGISAALTVVSGWGLLHFFGTPFEYDFRKLNAKLESTEDKRAFNQSLDKLFGRWPFPTVVLADSIDEVEDVRRTIRKQDEAVPGKAAVGQIVTIHDVLPGTPAEQARKLELLADLRKMVRDPDVEALPEADRKRLAELDPADDLRVLVPKDLPQLARRPFTEVDGTIGRAVLVYPPDTNFSVWNGRDLERMADVMQRLELPSGKTLETSGSAVVFSSMVRSILRDGPRATVASLGAVIVLLLLVMRPLSSAVPALLAMLVGVIWMVGGAGLAEVKITFLNFIALPITFGIGAEYALNVMARYHQTGDMRESVASTGGAVSLCSWTTIVGYGSLIAAHTQALRGFGMMAILGEVACLMAAVAALPSVYLWRERRKAAR